MRLPDIEARIRNFDGQLTPSEQRLAETVMTLGAEMAVMTAAEIATRAGTSQASATRFFRRLGYANWADLRTQMRPAWGSPLESLLENGVASGDHERHLAQEIDNLTRSYAEIGAPALGDAAALLAAAGRIRIVGLRNSRSLAGHARALLAHVHDDVMALPVTGMTLAEEAAALRAGDVILAIGFRRRPAAFGQFLQIAREQRLAIVLMSEPSAIDVARFADINLSIRTESQGPFDSYVAAISVLTHLAARMASMPGMRDRLARIEDLRGRLDL